MCFWVCARAYLCLCVCAWRPEVNIRCLPLLLSFQPIILRQGLSLKLVLACQWGPRICLCLSLMPHPPLRPALGSHTEVSGHTQVFMCVLGISTQSLTLVQQAPSHPLSGLNLLLLFLFKIFFINFSSEFLTMYLGHIHPQLLPATSPRSFLTSLPL